MWYLLEGWKPWWDNQWFCPRAKNLEIPTKVNCPLIDFDVRWGLCLIQTKYFGLRQLNSHWRVRIINQQSYIINLKAVTSGRLYPSWKPLINSIYTVPILRQVRANSGQPPVSGNEYKFKNLNMAKNSTTSQWFGQFSSSK